ncbi:hypothetical protein [Nocardioides sp.]|uniref:hypothetical protein n=1 Tax=Nocardioides sp. TaxID=35761 RepID=UPI001A31E413|nr:hypothetical protein [Nocardioides sp.]MBJ7358177.1 hypothetical protein [Nocardioides sp.]
MNSPRAVLHVGLPKTGTSFLQGVLRGNAEVLERHGVRLPDGSKTPSQQLFLAVLYLTGRSETWGRSADAGRRAWERFAADVRRRGGTTVISSETLCLATDEQIGRILSDLRGVSGEVDVDVVVTVRDPARQVPAEYQEGVKHGRRLSYPKFLDTVLAPDGADGKRGSTRRRFWNAQDPVAVLDRWAARVGPEHCHVVTCPPPGADPTLLWSRMAHVLGVDEVAVEMPPREVNTSLGAVQIEVLRRLNRRVTRQGNERVYGDVVKRLYAGTILRGQGGDKLRLPAAYADRVRSLASEWVEQLTERGYPVSGDLADLVPEVPERDAETRTGAATMLVSSLDATAELLREVERLREENSRLRTESAGSRLRRRRPAKAVKAGAGGRL